MANANRRTGQPQYTTLGQQDFSYPPTVSQASRDEIVKSSPPRMSGGKRTIYLALACILTPMIGLSGILVGLVLRYQVEKNQTLGGPLELAQRSDTDDSAYYVHINSTTFATIASWSSTVAPFLVIAAMSLVSFPVAQKLEGSSEAASSDLPTPFQLSLLLETLTGSITSVWTLVKYQRWPHKQPLASTVRISFIILIVASLIGYTVAGIDTWLHLAMDTVEMDLISTEQAGTHTYGRGLDQSTCSDQTVANFDVSACTVSLAVTGTFLNGSNEAFKTLNNLSSVDSVRRAKFEGKQLAYLGAASIPSRLDFQATTLAMYTQCTPISKKCDLHVESGASEPFKCPGGGFFGNIPSRYINGDTSDPNSGLSLLTETNGVIFYENEDLTKLANNSFRTRVQNPYHLGIWAYPFGVSAPKTPDENIVTPGHGGITWLLSCTTTSYDMTYSWVNGSARVDSLKQANGTMGTIINSPIYYGFGKPTLENNAIAASAEENSQALADSYAYLYSKTAMALVSGIMSGRPTLLEQVRESTLVARVPTTPLFMLVAFNCIYSIFGIILTILAIKTHPSTTNDVRDRLSIAGIVAFSFEGARARQPVSHRAYTFGEHSGESSARVGIERSESEGWEYTLREDTKQLG